MKHCPICQNADLHITQLSCGDCGIEMGGHFHTPPLARLSREETELATLLILHGGNLKTLAEALGITYPTLRKRLDNVITSLKGQQKLDENLIATTMDKIEHKTIPAGEGIRLIKEINNEL